MVIVYTAARLQNLRVSPYNRQELYSTAENNVNYTKNPLPTPTDSDLDSHTTPNVPKPVIIEEEEDKQLKTTASEIL